MGKGEEEEGDDPRKLGADVVGRWTKRFHEKRGKDGAAGAKASTDDYMLVDGKPLRPGDY